MDSFVLQQNTRGNIDAVVLADDGCVSPDDNVMGDGVHKKVSRYVASFDSAKDITSDIDVLSNDADILRFDGRLFDFKQGSVPMEEGKEEEREGHF